MSSGPTKRYRAFLSYSHTDQKWARWLHRALENYRPPKELVTFDGEPLPPRLTPIFRDRDELPTTASLSDAVNEALANSDKLILICSPAAAASRWVNQEVRQFRRMGRDADILCLVVDGEPGAGDETECFPPALLEPMDHTGKALEPVAADARHQGDGRKNALLRLIAGMLHVGFDALKQRDLRHRHQRMTIVTVSSLIVAAAMIMLAVAATMARREAEFRRAQAEELVEFMLGNLMERLRQIGRLDVYETISDEALVYFAEQNDVDVSDRTLAQRAKNLRQIGEIRMDQGDLAAAMVAFEESLLISARLVERDTEDARAQVGLANSHFYVGHVHYLGGNIVAARAQFEQVLPIVNRLAENEPANAEWLIERAYAYTNLGRVLELEGKLQEALVAYETVMSTNERLVELEPLNDDWHLEVAFAHNNIGKLVASLGRLDEAELNYRRDLTIKQRIFDSNPRHNLWRDYLGVSQYYLGKLLLERSKLAEAEEHLQAARENFDFLFDIDPERTNWRQRYANIERELGRLYVATERYDDGSLHLNTSIQMLDSLLQDDAANVRWRRELVQSLIVTACFEARRGKLPRAEDLLETAKGHLGTLQEGEIDNRESQALSIHAHVCAATIAAKTDDSVVNRNAYQALEKLESYFPESADPQILKLKSLALAAASRADEAEELRNHLLKMGVDIHAI